MLLWVGLGNPESSMRRHRHNVGFMAVEAIARKYGFTPWRNRFKGEVAEGRIGGQKVLLLLPMTYMNKSGESVQEAAAFYKIAPENITVFHDELDLAPGRLRIKRGGGAAGHNGLRSTDKMLGTPEYWRVRIGIGHPGAKERVHGWVLGNFTETDRQEWLERLLDRMADAAPLLADGRADQFMTKVALPEGSKG
ncbi:aminoacyl-tRNA hydrolase [Acetobacter pasteurianus]|uniref:Peptidyl-tRNA hydrolase n=7 Tax=Acetobacter TaxID=434 RepID=A0A1Y0Y0J8_ACEPA|nr:MULTISPECIES: aminoacyl-tRNA hydrolase [Acetobacter]NLG91569.1 aminoacyl-tRNA hydrolase [Acetobacter sp.]BAU37419.1 peptidyl-tRNA hydrolase [Acetobacter pasteurianus NBRC 101655]GBR56330.1 peptidyl-tRNA hydrolase [Acetobacter senegalensis DSM 18889]GCD74042.1 peptidyl-tRNA hydrolase [Acetobacter pasteurianus NBRC 3299]AKR48492.1 peptidyl-tRNA hydrolase [Acetobacter pasteurianus]